MNVSIRAKKTSFWLLFLILVYASSVGFFHYFYRGWVHGDTTAHFILAQAVLQTRQIFPVDFYYGNDLIFLRNQYAIALFQMLGAKGYLSYSLGSSLVISFCVTAVGLASYYFGKLGTVKAAIFALLVFLPLGYEEFEFVIGEQSHTFQVTLTLLGCFGLIAVDRNVDRLAALISFCAVLLTVWDSPPRGFLMVAALSVAVVALALQSRQISKRLAAFVALIGLALPLGMVGNKLAGVAVLGVGDRMALTTDAMAQRFSDLHDLFFQKFLGFENLGGQTAFGLDVLVSTAKMTVGLAIIYAAVVIPALTLRAIGRKTPLSAPLIMGAVSSALIWMGVLIVSMSQLDLDVRHFLPGLVLLKAALIYALLVWRGWVSTTALCCLTVSSSVFVTAAAAPVLPERLSQGVDHNVKMSAELIRISRQYPVNGPITLYGTFWTAMRYEVFIPDTVASAPIIFRDGQPHINKWLSRPSRYCLAANAILIVEPKSEPDLVAYVSHRYSRVGGAAGVDLYKVPGSFPVDCKNEAVVN